MLKRYTKGINKKYYIYVMNDGGVVMGVSMGVIKPIRGSAAQQLLKDSKRSSVDSKVLESCRKISSIISKK